MLQTFKSDPHPDTFTKVHVLSPLQINFYTKHHSLEYVINLSAQWTHKEAVIPVEI